MKQVYMINGLMGSGKDFTANELKNKLEKNGKTVEVLAFAEPMKFILSTIFDITIDELNYYKNNSKEVKLSTIVGSHDVVNNTDFRKLIQRFGSEGMKPVFGIDVWANLVYQKITSSNSDVIIISDFRFNNEFNYLKNMNYKNLYNIKTIRIIGSDDSSLNTHDSEKIPNIDFDVIIDNSKKNHIVSEWVDREVKSMIIKRKDSFYYYDSDLSGFELKSYSSAILHKIKLAHILLNKLVRIDNMSDTQRINDVTKAIEFNRNLLKEINFDNNKIKEKLKEIE
jgi:hypothetical protein